MHLHWANEISNKNSSRFTIGNLRSNNPNEDIKEVVMMMKLLEFKIDETNKKVNRI